MKEPVARDPRAAASQVSDSIAVLLRSLRVHRPDPDQLEEIAAILHLSFDTLWTVMEEASEMAPGTPNHSGPAEGWNRAKCDALNLRDHLGWSISKDFDWSRIPD
jgi:hypothetical protein